MRLHFRKYLKSRVLFFFFKIFEIFNVYIKLIMPQRYLFSLNECKCSLNNHFLFNYKDAQEILSVLAQRNTYKSILVHEADLIKNHAFDFLGTTGKVGDNIDWRADIRTAFTWPTYYHRDCPVFFDNDSDIVYVWELSRFQHLFVLSKAFLISGDETYLNEICSQISTWIKQNPYKMGPNWITAMDVSIRAINWILVLCLIEPGLKRNRFFMTRVLVLLYLHGKFLENNLPLRRHRSGKWIGTNHHMATLAGLIYLGFLFKDTSFGERWLHIGKSMLFSEIEEQFHHEGDNFEKATCYHRLVSEMVTSCIIILRINNYDIPERILVKMAKAYQFVVDYTRPDGKAPQVGDTDDGRLYRLGSYFNDDVANHSHLVELGKVLFHGHTDISAGRDVSLNEENVWLSYKLIREKKLPLDCNNKCDFVPGTISSYPGTGFYIYRGHDSYTLLLAGRVGTRSIGNHSHNDILSLEICFRGVPLIIDPGCHVYTGNLDDRFLYRSTCMHNTLQVDDQEINGIEKKKVFLMDEWAFPKVEKFEQHEDRVVWQATHYGFCQGDNKVIHERKVSIFNQKEPYWLIQDALIPLDLYDRARLPSVYRDMKYERNKSYVSKLYFHLNIAKKIKKLNHAQDIEKLRVYTNKEIKRSTTFCAGYEIETGEAAFRIISFSDGENYKSEILEYKQALRYGVRVASQKVVCQQQGIGIQKFVTYIAPVVE